MTIKGASAISKVASLAVVVAIVAELGIGILFAAQPSQVVGTSTATSIAPQATSTTSTSSASPISGTTSSSSVTSSMS